MSTAAPTRGERHTEALPSQAAPQRRARTLGPALGGLPAVVPAVLVMLLLTALAVVLIRDTVVLAGWASGQPWSTPVLEWFRAVQPADWMLPVGVVLVLVGLWCLVQALRRRPRRFLAVGGPVRAWLPAHDVDRLARSAAQSIDGVLDARVSARPGRVSVKVRGADRDKGELRDDVTRAVTEQLEGLDPQPSVSVSVRSTRQSGGQEDVS
jgi:copper chaperone CopZ